MPFVDGYGLTPLEGGWSGETFVAESAGQRTVVRLYVQRGARRGPRAVEVDAAVLRLVRGLLPVPEVLEVRRPDPAAGTPALLVTSLLPGVRLDTVLSQVSDATRAAVGSNLGVLLGRLAQMPMLWPGRLVDGDLSVEPWDEGADLVGWVESQRSTSSLANWTPGDYSALLEVADQAQTVLDQVTRVSLVHGDLNPKNVLVDPGTGVVTGLVDWEFCHAGAPVADLGNLLRFDREPVFARAVLDGYRSTVPDAGDAVLDQARAADMYALVELAGRRGENPVTEAAHRLLTAVARSGDLDAVP